MFLGIRPSNDGLQATMCRAWAYSMHTYQYIGLSQGSRPLDFFLLNVPACCN